jgi:hypothetical protein
MSLPLALKVSLSNLSSWPNLLMPSQPSIARWNKRFESIGGTGVRIGLIWNGGHREHMPSTWEINERRNIAFAQLSQLNHPKLNFFSLQKGEPAQSQLKADLHCHWQTPNFIDLMPEVNDFEDTAAIMMNMDLIIAVDTSCAHLAGALGKETWLLNRFDTCWRWLAQEKQSPWYPSIHIYRQASMGDWSKPLNDMKKDLADRFEL